MSFIPRGGSADVIVPLGQSIAIGSFGGGSARVCYQTTAANYPPTRYPQVNVSNGQVLLGPFAVDQPVRIDASAVCDCEYVVAAVPTLTQQGTPSAEDAITAHAGGLQPSARQLTATISRVTVVATAADSVKLPPAKAGLIRYVANADAADAMAVYPQSGEAINALAADASFSVAAGKTAIFVCPVDGRWHTILTA